jgi:hypothetical protein
MDRQGVQDSAMRYASCGRSSITGVPPLLGQLRLTEHCRIRVSGTRQAIEPIQVSNKPFGWMSRPQQCRKSGVGSPKLRYLLISKFANLKRRSLAKRDQRVRGYPSSAVCIDIASCGHNHPKPRDFGDLPEQISDSIFLTGFVEAINSIDEEIASAVASEVR